ncbi:MAG TPA: FKBP-type peptidyl-prolyl cis-trans isomerase N-terminal domain-containing protein [Arenimonas sp.]|uniref:FKBP-type peptidyl-prolyl cis-trans isomerase N-terminal domain-containing protein n=1 Tax=Arenimonas sp. TaxID=1872635 RepID=UPI002B67E5DD|nr:FKBP-type peptidyl-prolyl cis-trans isomerase N-terminal domain-containing protein [Arenimonas sp.]HMB58116.1 FKBP-type peptidyl-prolyl cis-trans isomerase N-terminal domain-containing protein [Arenimonas sp.]
MKLRLLAATLAVLTLSSGVALAQTAAPAAAAPAAAPAASDRTTLSYALGYEYGSNLAESKSDLDVNTIIRALQDGYAKRQPTMPGDKLEAALQQFEQKMVGQQKAELERVTRENKSKSDAFLAANRVKTGVTVLPNGIQYRVIETGTGVKPTAASTVQLHLMGSISSGQQFANTYASQNAQPVSYKVSDLPVAGLKDIIPMMPVGSRWEVFLPPEKAFGNDPRGPGGPAQVLIFDVKLIGTK